MANYNRVDLERLWNAARDQSRDDPNFDYDTWSLASGSSASNATTSELEMLRRWCVAGRNPRLREMATAIGAAEE